MAEILNVSVESINRGSSTRVTPVSVVDEAAIITIPGGAAGEDGGAGEANPQDAWLPITESRKGNIWSVTFELLCSGIGFQALLLPVAFASLGWFWGIFGLCLIYLWQLYTIRLLVDLHESSPPNGIRYSRFVHLSIIAFGEKLGKILAIFPTMYLSGGTCVMFTITGGTILELFYMSMCDNNAHCRAKTLTGAEWYLVFICLTIFMAQFFPNLNSVASVSAVGSVAGVAYCTLLWTMSVAKGRIEERELYVANGDVARFRDVVNGIAMLALAFRGHNLVLEIQGTLPTNGKQPSRKSMWRGVTISYSIIAMCLFPLAIAGHWAYGNKMPPTGMGILTAFANFHHDDTSKHMTGAICLAVIISFLCAFQIYAMPTFDNLERIYTSKKDKPCPRWVRSAIKVFFGGLVYLISVALPFLPRMGAIIGGFTLPLTLTYPCLMWVAIKKPRPLGRMWWLNQGVGFTGVVLSIMVGVVALWSLIINGLDANFFNPE